MCHPDNGYSNTIQELENISTELDILCEKARNLFKQETDRYDRIISHHSFY